MFYIEKFSKKEKSGLRHLRPIHKIINKDVNRSQVILLIQPLTEKLVTKKLQNCD